MGNFCNITLCESLDVFEGEYEINETLEVNVFNDSLDKEKIDYSTITYKELLISDLKNRCFMYSPLFYKAGTFISLGYYERYRSKFYFKTDKRDDAEELSQGFEIKSIQFEHPALSWCFKNPAMHAKPEEKFYIPENVYIIGTMNDIDRSVDSFDFAMRRRFRFVEVKADERLEMLANLNDEEKEAEAIKRMTALNNEIANTEGLNENYQIGAAYFLKLKTLDFDQLWTDFLRPLLQEYVVGMYDEAGIMEKFEKAYGYKRSSGEIGDESN